MFDTDFDPCSLMPTPPKSKKPSYFRTKTVSLEETWDFNFYSAKVRLLANIFNPRWFPIEYKDGVHQIDHKFSVSDGFKHCVPLQVIGNINNLQVLTKTENLSKNTSSCITIQELYNTAAFDPQYLSMVVKLDGAKNMDALKRWYQLLKKHLQL
jgi:hypothetical protein